MDKSKNIIKLTSTSAASTTFQPLSAIPVSARIRSILEVVGKNVHLCSLSEDGTHLAVLEHHTDVLEHHTDVLVRGTLLGEAERAKIGQPADDCVSSSQSVKKNEAQQGSEIGKQATVIFVIDLQSGWCSRLGSIVGLCSVAVFHTRAPLLAVLQPPHRVHIYHVELRCCCEVIEFSNVTDALLGLQWLPHHLVSPRQPGEMLPPETSSGSVSSAVQKAGDESDARSAGASGLLSFSPCELVTFRSPVPCERLSVQPSVYWAGTVLDGTTVVLVREDGTLELLPLTGGTALPLPPLPGLSLHLPVISVSLMSCGRILLVVLRERRVVWCDVKERTMSLISLDTPASPSVLRSAVALSTSHPRYPQVVVLLDSTGAVHVLEAQRWSCLRTVRPPSLTVENMSISSGGELLCLTYSNRTSKLYRLHSLLPLFSESVRTRSLSDKENRHGTLGAKESVVSKTSDCTDTAGNRSETSAPHRVHFGEVVENGSKCAEAASSKSSLKKVKLAASHPDWRKLLDEFGSFPSSERAAVWCGLLRLPRCAVIHRNLDGKVLHDAVPLYSSMADQSLRNTFRRTLSCLYYWAPQLSSVPWVPSFVFPFVKSLQHTPLICFELCVTLLVSWCRLWFSTAPDALVPPVLNTVEMLVCDASPRLMAALMHAHVTAHTYVWPLLSTAFAQVLSAEDWAVAWDHLLCRPPSFLLCFAAAYTLCLALAIRTAAADQPRHIENLYSQESYLPVRSVLKRAAELHDSMKLDAELLCRLDAITPFPEGGLPVFHNIPDMQAIKLDSSAAEGGGGALQTLGWSLDEAEFERERAALREREERCIAAIRRVRKQHFGLS